MKKYWLAVFVVALLLVGSMIRMTHAGSCCGGDHSATIAPIIGEIQAGYGSCGRCYCQGFEGFEYTCSNCGHSYYNHY